MKRGSWMKNRPGSPKQVAYRNIRKKNSCTLFNSLAVNFNYNVFGTRTFAITRWRELSTKNLVIKIHCKWSEQCAAVFAWFCCAVRRCISKFQASWPHCHKAQIGGELQWWLTFCKFLPSPHTISGAQPKWPSSSWSPFFLPRPFAPISWLGGQLQEESCSKLLLFKTYECHCALEDLQWEALELYFKCQSKRVWILTSMRYFSFSFFIHLHFLNSVSAFSSWCIECRFKWEKKLQHNKSSVANLATLLLYLASFQTTLATLFEKVP